MEENTIKVYEDENHYAQDCIYAAVGTLLSEDYYTRPLEILIGHEKVYQNVCSAFISFVKTMERDTAEKYTTPENFNEYFLKDGKEFTQEEQGIANVIFDRIAYNKENSLSELKEPKALTKRLMEARKKLNTAKSIEILSTNEAFKNSPVTWSSKYYESLQESISDINDQTGFEDTDDAIKFADDLAEDFEKTLEARENGEVYKFHNSVFDGLITEGPTPGHGGIIGGSTGMGKSTLCLNLVNNLIDADVPIMYFPIEMGVENTMDRLMACRTKTLFKKITKFGQGDENSAELKEKLLHELKALRTHSNFAFIKDANINMKKLKRYIKRFQSKLPGRKYCIVIIDLLLMISEFYDSGDGNMAQMIERAINKLDILSKELGIHYIGVVQLNRSIETDKIQTQQQIDKLKPTRSAIKNSNALLERARWAITIFRKRYFADLYLTEGEAATVPDVAEIQLMKANDEAISRRYMIFDGAHFIMSETLPPEMSVANQDLQTIGVEGNE